MISISISTLSFHGTISNHTLTQLWVSFLYKFPVIVILPPILQKYVCFRGLKQILRNGRLSMSMNVIFFFFFFSSFNNHLVIPNYIIFYSQSTILFINELKIYFNLWAYFGRSTTFYFSPVYLVIFNYKFVHGTIDLWDEFISIRVCIHI